MFVTDEARAHCLGAIRSHIDRKDSLLITANYGCGKTALLKQMKNTSTTVRVRSLGSLYQLLARIAGVKDANPRHKDRYLDYRCEHPATIIIDEAQDLPHAIYPYLKIVMDAGSSIILAGLPELFDALKDRHPDVKSRLTHIKLEPLTEGDMFKLVSDDFDPDAFSIIYGSSFDMREMMSHIKNCRDYIKANNITTVGIDTVMKFIE
ncbi:ATP-binding protein [Methylovulum psychrotolerans]|uniref:ORC1/DEAH AAA+ ATPase domain-containing protein n=1 Tax=Methylovulum psychrotolerans TaxID=1704499 RepID=A0A1Z4C0H0_9GAMM|nr:ATP-binding protein [Methylovulum psychrotolerans]ASF47025.1 hypothetical protein CEK71_13610 [Methylovulum psychrotolerans]